LGANSAIRQAVKKILFPLTNEKTYKYAQAVSKAWDIKSGSWSEPELDLVPLALREGETALDIGANFGIYAYHMSRAVGKTGKVYSFEPVPFTFATLRIIARLLGFSHNVELIEKGCGDQNGTITFAVPVQTSGAFSTGQAYIGRRNDNRAGREAQVRWAATKDVAAEIVRLDDFLPEIKDLSLVKADIEGAELFCFRGAEKIISKHLPTIICEINPWFLEGFNVKLEELLNFFFEKGYQIFQYVNDGGAKRLRLVSAAEIVEDNYVLLHPSRTDRVSHLLN
jgi:FkbM family methyltransferase